MTVSLNAFAEKNMLGERNWNLYLEINVVEKRLSTIEVDNNCLCSSHYY